MHLTWKNVSLLQDQILDKKIADVIKLLLGALRDVSAASNKACKPEHFVFSHAKHGLHTIEWEMQDRKERIISLQYFH